MWSPSASLTPTALKSPTNGSNPPHDRHQWEPVTIIDSQMDYYPMPLSRNQENHISVQNASNEQVDSCMVLSMAANTHVSTSQQMRRKIECQIISGASWLKRW
ncbi:hypothetical protein BYT27DRAFT_7200743 [Phlegmacium glaucopus]|nr:hypothetical protein BYT27DRAFT_7200743 [Phlegmacium glaucopus]